MKILLTKRQIDALAPSERKSIAWDMKLSGFGVKVEPTGVKTFLYAYRFPRGRAGRMRYYTIGRCGDFTVDEARERAEILQGEYKKGLDPMARLQAERAVAKAERTAPKRSVQHVCREFVERYAKRNRSWKETDRILKRHVISAWGARQMTDISRADVNELLDDIEDSSGAPMATAVLAQIRKMFNWYATRDDNFNSPIVKGMARISPKQMARDRTLSDDEIRALWRALDECEPPYRQLVRFLLLTAQRREEVARSRYSEFSGSSWAIPAERSKTNKANKIPLSAAALKELDTLNEFRAHGEYVFTTTGTKPFSGFSKAKRHLDEKMKRWLKEQNETTTSSENLKPWRLHDLRRTAKTLMQRSGVRPDISERVLGHVIAGVEGTYDRHDYYVQKETAMRSLASEIERILSAGNAPTIIKLRHIAIQ
jgi:integrase